MGATKFTDLVVWQKAYALTLTIYKLTSAFPPIERFRLAAQMCRAAASMPANIAEGFGRVWPRDQAHFYTIAKSSAEDLKVHPMLTRDLGYARDVVQPLSIVDEICAMLYVLRDRVMCKSSGR